MMTDTSTTIDANTIRILRERRIDLCADLDEVDGGLVALGVNPRLESLLAAILKAAARPLSTGRLYEHTKELGLHNHTWKNFVLHLDRLHAAGTIVPVGEKKWAVKRPTPARTLPSTPALEVD